MSGNESERPSHFIRKIIDEDIQSGKHGGTVVTRFPPEPNGYLHIGHAKSICLNFGLAEDFNGSCNLRFDDTNPQKENVEFVEAIKADVKWLGYDWQDRLFYASDYFEKLYGYAVELITNGKAYVCDLNAEQTREYRGSLTAAGKNSPYRDRSVEENLDLFARMRAGEFADGEKLLRARIDMASPNMNMRDPVLYRIRMGVTHHQTGKEWPIYPMYDFTHPLSDALEGITHSLCTLEFEDHRPLYDWVIDNVSIECHPQQIEFSRLNLEYTVMSKRKLTLLVEKGLVDGWSDPRMPTLAGLRRRGYTPESIREFCDRIGVTRSENLVEMGVLESCIREDLNEHAPRRMAVLRPLKVVIENMAEDQEVEVEAQNHPQQPEMGSRMVKLTRELYIDRDDFKEEASRKFKRLVAGGEVRLRYGYVIRCDQVIKDDSGEIIELRCHCDMATLGAAPEGRKVKGVIHWVSAKYGQQADVRLYDRLFGHETPDNAGVDDFTTLINPESLQVLDGCIVEPALAESVQGEQCQFEREGYFCLDANSSNAQQEGGKLVFNRVVTLRDTWAKIEQKK